MIAIRQRRVKELRPYRHANNLGSTLASEPVEQRVGIHLDVALTDPSPPCAEATPSGPGTAVRVAVPEATEEHAFEQAYRAGWFERGGFEVEPSPMAERWAHG